MWIGKCYHNLEHLKGSQQTSCCRQLATHSNHLLLAVWCPLTSGAEGTEPQSLPSEHGHHPPGALSEVGSPIREISRILR